MEASFHKLGPGSRVAVASPSSAIVDRAAFRAGIRALSERYEVSVPPEVFRVKGFLAGTDRSRLRTLVAAIGDASTAAIFAARGGHGSTRLLASIDWEEWYRRRIPIVGFSDVTAIQMAALALAGVSTVHGPTVTSLARQPRAYLAHLFRLLEDPSYDFAAPPCRLRSLRQGRVTGNLVGGNLTMLDQLAGTAFLPDLSGCVLFVEDVGEAPYRVDRMLVHLRNAGILDRIAGVLVGDFTACRPRKDGVTVDDVLEEHARTLRIPFAAGMPSGHGRRNWAFLQGAVVDMKCGQRGERATLMPVGRTEASP